MIRVTDCWSYVRDGQDPLSSNVVVIKGKNATYLFDVGANEEAFRAIEKINGPKIVIVSHFHQDHIANLSRLDALKVYVGPKSARYIPEFHLLEIVKRRLVIYDGVQLEIVPLPSSHAQSCLALVIDREAALLGDGTYPGFSVQGRYYNVQLIKEQLEVLKSLDVPVFGLSHQDGFLYRKEEVISELEEIYAVRDPHNPIMIVG